MANQRKFDAALKVLNQALKESRLTGALKLTAQLLLLRAAVIDYARVRENTLPDLRQALRILQDLDEPRLTLGTHMNIAYAQVVAGRYCEALKEITKAWALWQDLPKEEGGPMMQPQLEWLEGLAQHGSGNFADAQLLYEKSHNTFLNLLELEHAAIVALDCTRLYVERGYISEGLELAIKAQQVLQDLGFPEATEAAAVMQEAVRNTIVSVGALEAARVQLVKVYRATSRQLAA